MKLETRIGQHVRINESVVPEDSLYVGATGTVSHWVPGVSDFWAIKLEGKYEGSVVLMMEHEFDIVCPVCHSPLDGGRCTDMGDNGCNYEE